MKKTGPQERLSAEGRSQRQKLEPGVMRPGRFQSNAYAAVVIHGRPFCRAQAAGQ